MTTKVYVIEVNPRSSRTIPYISKVTGVPIIELATRCMLGERLKDLGYGTGLYPSAKHVAVKMPVFSFEKLTDVDTGLGPEMKSTGEVLGIDTSFPQALLKAFLGSGMKIPRRSDNVVITVKDEDKGEIVPIAKKFEELGVNIYATAGTAKVLKEAGVFVRAGLPHRRAGCQHPGYDHRRHGRSGHQHAHQGQGPSDRRLPHSPGCGRAQYPVYYGAGHGLGYVDG